MDYSGIDYPQVIEKQGEFINMISSEFGRCSMVVEEGILIFYGEIIDVGKFARWEVRNVNEVPVRTF